VKDKTEVKRRAINMHDQLSLRETGSRRAAGSATPS
jgi:hypothetical protein